MNDQNDLIFDLFFWTGVAVWTVGGLWLFLRVILHCALKAFIDAETLVAVAKTLARKL